ncbi:hypothetical protein ACWGCW_06715 [Streptomyces sp. NPDC054933]
MPCTDSGILAEREVPVVLPDAAPLTARTADAAFGNAVAVGR